MTRPDIVRAIHDAYFEVGVDAVETNTFGTNLAALGEYGISEQIFSLSESAALPQVVPKKQLSTAVAQNQARIQGADLAGQPLGGLLFGISRLLPFAADAISYAISFV